MTTDSDVTSVAASSARDGRRERFALRSKLQRISKLRRLGTCGAASVDGQGVAVYRGVRQDGTAAASVRGLITCGSVWSCPVCAVHIRAERADEMRQGLDEHRARGGGAVLVTLTMRHCLWSPAGPAGSAGADVCERCGQGEDRHSLETLWDALADSWRRVQQRQAFRAARERLDVLGFMRAFEVTYGPNGWHPHLHLVLLTGDPVTPSLRDEVYRALEIPWLDETAKHGFRGLEGIAVDVRRLVDEPNALERVAGYVTKSETAHLELARGDRKRPWEGGSYHTWDLLQAAGDGEVWALHAWWEWEATAAGRRAIEWSRGLRDRLGLGAARSDEEIVEDVEDLDEVELIAVVTDGDWLRLRRCGLVVTLLEAVEDRGAAGLMDVFGEVERRTARGDPPWWDDG